MQVALSPFDIACMLGLELMSQSNGAVHTLYCCLSHHVLHHDTSICRVTFVHPPQTIDIRHHARVPALNQNLKPLRFRSSMDNLQHKSAVRRLAGHLSPPPYPNLQYIYIHGPPLELLRKGSRYNFLGGYRYTTFSSYLVSILSFVTCSL